MKQSFSYSSRPLSIFEMFLALVMVMLFYIVLLYVWVSLYVWTVVSAGYPALLFQLSDVHVHMPNLYLHIDEQIKNE